MKRTITLCAAVCISYINYAQSPDSAVRARIKMLELMTRQSTTSNAKTTATMQRLIGSARIEQGTTIADSAVYYYDFGRGSTFDFDQLKFYAARPFPYFLNSGGVMYDSCHKEVGAGSSSIKYTAGNLPASYHYYVSIPNSRETYIYDAQQQLIEVISESHSGMTMTWTLNSRTKYGYTAGRLVADTSEQYSLGSWILTHRSDYHYNAGGQLDTAVAYQYNSGNWIPFNKYSVTYNWQYPARTVYEMHDGVNWVNTRKVEKIFTTNQKVVELWYNWTGGNWIKNREEYRHLNSDFLPDSVFSIDPIWDTIITKLAYNSFNNPVTIDYAVSSLNLTYQERFWYQEHDPLKVNETMVATRLSLYPNPAREQVNVVMDQLKEGSMMYTIINKLGQSVLEGNAPVSDCKLTIDTRRLQPGMYWLQMRDIGGEKYTAAFVID